MGSHEHVDKETNDVAKCERHSKARCSLPVRQSIHRDHVLIRLVLSRCRQIDMEGSIDRRALNFFQPGEDGEGLADE